MEYSGAFGEFFKAKRQALGLTLREFCLKHKLDPGNISRLERGLLAPPQGRERLGFARKGRQVRDVSCLHSLRGAHLCLADMCEVA